MPRCNRCGRGRRTYPRESREVAVESPGGHVTEPGEKRLGCRVGRASRGRAVPSVPRTRNSGAPPRPSLRAWTQALLPVGRRDSPAGAHPARASPASRASSPSGGSPSAIACDSSPGILSRLLSRIVRTIAFSPFADMPPSSPPGVGEACDCGIKNIKWGLTQPLTKN